MTGRILGGLLAVLCLALAGPGQAELRAVLVGVSDYELDGGLADLRGPANDVRLMADVLGRRGADLTLLADGVDGAARPTRAAILGALADQARIAGPGDFVYIHLSGHGTRQSDLDGDESDGQDEVFLPIDVGRAAPGSGVIPNAIVDEELGAAVDAIRARGADVWLVLDSCHSGTGTRMVLSGLRYVDPVALGVDIAPSAVTERAIVAPAAPADLPGGFLAFYAAQSNEYAREVDMARPGDAPEVYGLFTARLAARLDRGGAASFRQLYQAVLADLNDSSLAGADRLQTPGWEGGLIDAPVLGGVAGPAGQRHALRGRQVLAGQVHGLAEGTLLALYADAMDPETAVIGHAQVTRAGATASRLVAVAGDCAPRRAAPCAPAGALPEAARFAQVVARPLDMVVQIAPPRDLATGRALAADHPVARALAAAVAASPAGTGGYAFALTDAGHEVETLFDGRRLWFGPQAQVGGQAVGLAWDGQAAQAGTGPALAVLLERIGKAETLARVMGGLAGSAPGAGPVDLRGALRPVRAADLARPGAVVDPVEECLSAWDMVAGQPFVPFDGGRDLKQCDSLHFRARGLSARLIDVNRVHIDSQYCIHAAYAPVEGITAEVAVGEDLTICADCPGAGYVAGDERLFLIATERPANAEALNLEGRVENCPPATRDATRGNAADAAIARANAYLAELAQVENTRGAMMGLSAVSDIWVTRRDWRVLPREQALLRAGEIPAP
ncbi:caspase family protein [Marinibacterium sp. SX1]|uniref:caspase family protein n=1 Tax=Marinibacterium sp. SX1 TaxID=3388424 RepID=UPI003D175E67